MSRIIIKNYNLLRASVTKQFFEKSNKTVCISRLYFTSRREEIDNEEDIDAYAANYEDTSNEFGIGKKFAIMKLQELFSLRLFVATDIAARFKRLQTVTGKTMSDNYRFLKQEGIADSIILKYPEVLAQTDLQQKIYLLKTLSYDICDAVPLLVIDLLRFRNFINKQNYENLNIRGGRIGFFSTLLKLSISDTCEILTNRVFLQKINLEKAEANCKSLLKFGVTLDEIKNDLWVLCYNTAVIKERLETMEKMKIGKAKTWMVRALPKIIDRYVERKTENKLILGENSLVEYLSERLQCSPERAKLLLTKHPALLTKSMKKIKEIIDFLYDDGFTSMHILRNPKILLHSVQTTGRRLRELEAQGMKVTSLHILTKSQKQYMNYYENLVKSNKNKMQDAN